MARRAETDGGLGVRRWPASAAADVGRLLKDDDRVLAIDPFDLGEAKPIYPGGDVREPKYTSDQRVGVAVGHGGRAAAGRAGVADRGRRPLGRGAETRPVRRRGFLRPAVVAHGAGRGRPGGDGHRRRRTARLGGSLKEAIERNDIFDAEPEAFCFGLLEAFDVKQLAGLCARGGFGSRTRRSVSRRKWRTSKSGMRRLARTSIRCGERPLNSLPTNEIRKKQKKGESFFSQRPFRA